MTQEQAEKIFEQTGNLQNFIINMMDAYEEQLAATKTIKDRDYKTMVAAISGCKIIVNKCFKNKKS